MQIQRARPEDSPLVAGIARDAFGPYIRRIGRPPAPMEADYAALIRAGEVWTLSHIADTVGFVVLRARGDSLHVDTLAVAPQRHGEGHGRRLLDFAEAEARRRGLPRLDLYTNALMRENLSLYAALGWRETARRRENGFDRVYFEKDVVPAPARF